MAVDKYGILKLYPSVGLEWYNRWDNGRTRYLGKEIERDPYDNRLIVSSGTPKVNVMFRGDGVARFRNSVPTTSVRLWVNGPWLNTEITVYALKVNIMPDIQLRSRSNHYQDGRPYQCTFGCFAANWQQVDRRMRFSVEPMHPIYKRYINNKVLSYNEVNWQDYIGFKFITRTLQGNKVKLESWYNPTKNDQTKWYKQNEFIVTNNNLIYTLTPEEESYRRSCIGQEDRVADNLTAASCWLKPGRCCWLRLNNSSGWNLKHFSIREIAPI